MRKKNHQEQMWKNIGVIVAIVLLSIVVLAVCLVIFVNYRANSQEEEVVALGMERAKSECVKKQYGDECTKLKYILIPPQDWGTRSYLMLVQSLDKVFNVSLAIEYDNGAPRVISFDYNT